MALVTAPVSAMIISERPCHTHIYMYYPSMRDMWTRRGVSRPNAKRHEKGGKPGPLNSTRWRCRPNSDRGPVISSTAASSAGHWPHHCLTAQSPLCACSYSQPPHPWTTSTDAAVSTWAAELPHLPPSTPPARAENKRQKVAPKEDGSPCWRADLRRELLQKIGLGKRNSVSWDGSTALHCT